MAPFGCLIALLLAIAPRALLMLAWVVADRWVLVWEGHVLLPTLGIAFMPYTTIMYLLVWTPNGVAGFAWMWLLLGVLLDLAIWALGLLNRQATEGHLDRSRRFASRAAGASLRSFRRLVRRCARALVTTPISVWILLLIALLLRLAGVAFGLPQQLDPDERIFVQGALRMLTDGDLDPGWYGGPASTLMGGLAILYGAYGAMGVLAGTFETVADVGSAYLADASHFLVIGRVFTAFAGAVVVLLTYAVSRQLRVSVFWSIVAMATVTLSPVMVKYSLVVRMDMFQIAFIMLVLLMVLKAMTRPTLGKFVLAGLFLGLAVASKYPGILAVVPIIAAAVVLTGRGRITWTLALVYLTCAAVASLVAVLVVAPYLFLDPEGVLAHVRNEARSAHLGATGDGFVSNLWRYLTEALPQALGVPGAVVAILGVASMALTRRAWLTTLFFLAYLVFISLLALWWVRWALPVIPVAAIGAVHVAGRIESQRIRLVRGAWLHGMRVAVVGLLVIPLLSPTASLVWARLTNDDVRIGATEWLESNVPRGSTLVVESYTPQVSSDDYHLLVARSGSLIPWPELSDQLRPAWAGILGHELRERSPGSLAEEIEANDADYVLLSTFAKRYRAEAEDYPNELAVYEMLLDAYPTVQTFGDDQIIVLSTGDP